MDIIGQYFRRRRLQPNAVNTEVWSFHLNNEMSNTELQIHFGDRLRKNLGVKLDGTISYKEYLMK